MGVNILTNSLSDFNFNYIKDVETGETTILATVFSIQGKVSTYIAQKGAFSINFCTAALLGRGEKLSETDKVKGGLILM